jgi:hypothetical protein
MPYLTLGRLGKQEPKHCLRHENTPKLAIDERLLCYALTILAFAASDHQGRRAAG